MLRNLLALNTICRIEPGQIYAIDLAIMIKKSELRPSDVKPVNLDELLNTKTANSYINLENAGNNFYFIATKVPMIKPKKITGATVQTVNSSRGSIIAPQMGIKIPINTDDRTTIKKIRLDASPTTRTRLDSSGPAIKSYSPFISNVRRHDDLIKIDSDKKSQISKSSKFNEHNSEIVNIYRKPLYGIIIRIEQSE